MALLKSEDGDMDLNSSEPGERLGKDKNAYTSAAHLLLDISMYLKTNIIYTEIMRLKRIFKTRFSVKTI